LEEKERMLLSLEISGCMTLSREPGIKSWIPQTSISLLIKMSQELSQHLEYSLLEKLMKDLELLMFQEVVFMEGTQLVICGE
jgi:hypothetical protein